MPDRLSLFYVVVEYSFWRVSCRFNPPPYFNPDKPKPLFEGIPSKYFELKFLPSFKGTEAAI